MGADLIGYQTMYPEKFDQDEKEKLLKFIKKIESFLSTPNLAELLTKESKATDPYYKLLNELVPYIAYEIEEQGIQNDEDEIQCLIEEVLAGIEEGKSFLDFPNVSGRDSSDRVYVFGGRTFIAVFAGESTWGDEPEGSGYTKLKQLDRIGLLHEIETLCLPSSEPNSIRFTKED